MSLITTLFGNRRSNICHPFPMEIWAPFHGFPSSSKLNKTHGTAAGEVSAFSGACINWKETPEAHVFRVDLPGLKKEEVKVEVEEGRVLQISVHKSREQEEKNDKCRHRVERSSGKSLRRFKLPEDAKAEEIKAAMENGVLTVTVPKEEAKKPQVKAIDVSG